MAQTKQPPATPVTPGGSKLTAAERRAQRAAEAKLAQQRRQRRTLLIGLAVALVLAVGVFFVVRQQIAQRDVIGVRIPDEGQGHLNEGTPLTFQHYPPSSGKHYPTPQPAGIYRQEIAEGYWVHSLEHGYVVALLRCNGNSCDQLYQQFQDLYDHSLPKSQQFGNVKFVVTPYSHPYSDGDAPIVLVAWDYELKLQSFNRDKIIGFYKAHLDKGPEQVP